MKRLTVPILTPVLVALLHQSYSARQITTVNELAQASTLMKAIRVTGRTGLERTDGQRVSEQGGVWKPLAVRMKSPHGIAAIE